MARSKPPLVRLRDLAPGQFADFFAQLVERAKGSTRDGKPFYTCRFRDAGRTVTFMVWADGGWFDACEREWGEGQFYKLRGCLAEHERYGPQLELQNLRPVNDADRADGFDPADYVERPRTDPAAMLAELRGLVETQVADLPLRRLVLTVLERHATPFLRVPATRDKFYPFAGGLLEHTLSVTRICVRLMEEYGGRYAGLQPPLNRDLVVAGAVLHDVGRVAEFEADSQPPQATVPGRLLGHIFLGRDLVREAAREQGDVDEQLLLLLEHVLVAHLALPEWGSPRLPLIPECLIVHHADDLDAKLEMYARCLSRDQTPGPFTARDPVLNRQLFKGRGV